MKDRGEFNFAFVGDSRLNGDLSARRVSPRVDRRWPKALRRNYFIISYFAALAKGVVTWEYLILILMLVGVVPGTLVIWLVQSAR
jgi:Flp pilus assembly protein TadB